MNQQTTTFQKSCFWLGEAKQAVFAWLYQPAQPQGQAVVLCPPLGHEYIHTHRSYRYLAESLAEAGVTVLRLDLYGTGDAAGSLLEAHLLARWQNNICAAAIFLRQLHNVKSVGLFGVRMGATLALLAALPPVAFVALWNPVLSGKRYVRELKAVSRMSAAASAATTDFYEAGGFPICADLEQGLLDLRLEPGRTNAVRYGALLLDDVNDPQREALQALFGSGCELTTIAASGYSDMLAEPQFTQVPVATCEQVVAWVRQLPLQASDHTVLPQSTSLLLNGGNYTESPQWFGRVFAVLCRPQHEIRAVLVLANSGSVHHVGPNRLYVELSRQLAASGVAVLRLDLSNLGDAAHKSQTDENVTYPDTAVADVLQVLRLLREQYAALPLVLGGVCSGAHSSFHAALAAEADLLDRIIVINPLTFYWCEGMSLDIPTSYEVNKEATHYEQSLKSRESWKKLFTGRVNYAYLFTFVLKLCWKRSTVALTRLAELSGMAKKTRLAADIVRIRERGIQVSFILSERDPSRSILREEGGYTVARLLKQGSIQVYPIADADHTFSKALYRERLLLALLKIIGTPPAG